MGFVISQCPDLSSPLPPHLHPGEKEWPLCSRCPGAPLGGQWGAPGRRDPRGSLDHVAGPRLTQAGQSDLQSVASDYTLFPVDRQREPWRDNEMQLMENHSWLSTAQGFAQPSSAVDKSSPLQGPGAHWRMLILRPFTVPLTAGSPVKC